MIFRDTNFRVKIFIIMFIAIFLPMVSVGSIIYKRSEMAITEQTTKVVASSLGYVINNIDISMETIISMSNLLVSDMRITSVASKKTRFMEGQKTVRYIEIRQLMDFLMSRARESYTLSGIESLYVYLQNQNTIIDSKSTYYENLDTNNVDFLKKLEDKEYKGTWFVADPVNFNTLNRVESRLSTHKVISCAREILNKDGERIAAVSINFRDDFINDYYNKIQTGISGDFIVMDSSSTIISHTNENSMGKKLPGYSDLSDEINKLNNSSGSFFINIDDENKFVVYAVSPYTNWRYAVIIPAQSILGKVYEIQDFLFMIITVTALLVLGITYMLSSIFYKPLEKLVFAMQQIESRNLDVRIDDKRRDEYRKVYNGFNKMVVELKSLIKDLTNEKILKKEAEIKLLQAQINPHFLYNTFESIYSIAKIKKVDEISQMVSALSRFFRTSLSGGKEAIPLKDAAEMVSNYLIIQNIRFKDKIDYKINIPEEALECIVPKLVLQPIVENSIYHAIEKKKGKGMLVVSAALHEDSLELTVEDDGVGIPVLELLKLRNSLESDSFEDSKNFALKNINRQIKLKYGQNFGIEIYSVEGEGTRTMVRLPIVYYTK